MTTNFITFTHSTDDGKELSVNLLNLKKAALVLRAINHKLRQVILKQIDESGKITVTELYVKLRLEQSVASQHLAILRKAGFVNTERSGKYIFYSINPKRIREVIQFVDNLLASNNND
ncbi:MAG: metalloregulator ArsR/SmtB family transcription factor [Chitinophagaceae bacterium]|nr:metalloregulator ArsR/SmtB family transcription factor [Chitinophagaceae bacterium]